MGSYLELLEATAKQNKSILCMGLDPVLDRIPLEGTPYEQITQFFKQIFEQMDKDNVKVGAVKPNSAFFEQYGMEGMQALEEVINMAKQLNVPIILDAKRGDIGNTSKAYAKAAFSYLGADALTVAPFMGKDSVDPFLACCDEGKGVYILTRTSNPGAKDFQDLKSDDKPLYHHVAEKIVEWFTPGISAVVGATYPEELLKILQIFSGRPIPLLIPGVGTQGGDLDKVLMIISGHSNPFLQRINSSSGILYAFEKEPQTPFAVAAVEKITSYNQTIAKILQF